MNNKPVVRCADHLASLWSKGVRGTVMIVVPLILLSKLLGQYAWILNVLAFVIVVFRLIGHASASKQQACPACGSEGKIVCEGRKVKLSCPACQDVFETDCEIPYAGAKPSKVN